MMLSIQLNLAGNLELSLQEIERVTHIAARGDTAAVSGYGARELVPVV
jgi:hypothetical protein